MSYAPQQTLTTAHQSKKWEVNITPIERAGRIIVGLIGVIGGILLLAGSPSLLTGTLEVLLIAVGLDLAVTGATGHCPLYKKLGFTPKSLQQGQSKEELRHEHDEHQGHCH